jgi:hypothetical protein
MTTSPPQRAIVQRTFLQAVLWALLCFALPFTATAQPGNPLRYGALAFDDVTGAHGMAHNAASAGVAERRAIAMCASPGCKPVVTFTRGCAALAVGKGRYGAARAPNKAIAQRHAMTQCADPDCKLEIWACNDRDMGAPSIPLDSALPAQR